MATVIKEPKVYLKPGSPLGEGLKKMSEHKKLRQQYLLSEITFEELNQNLREKGINFQHEHPSAVPL